MENKSQIFDWARFCACLRRDLLLDGRKWLLRALAIIGVTFILAFTVAWPEDYEIKYNNFDSDFGFIIRAFTFIVGLTGAALFCENYNTPGKCLNSIMSPSSTFEKYLTRFLLCIVGMLTLFYASAFIAYILRYFLLVMRYGDIVPFAFFESIKTNSLKSDLVFFLALQATFVLGSTIWQKNAFLKTIGVLVAVSMISNFIQMIVYGISINILYGQDTVFETRPNAILLTYNTVLGAIWTIFCYVTAYFRMKESEIIHRM